jgi:hypothetical protein
MRSAIAQQRSRGCWSDSAERGPLRARMESGCQRDVAQLGRALRLGRRSRRFKSCHPDHVSRPWSKWIRHPPSKRNDGGSIPSGRTCECATTSAHHRATMTPWCVGIASSSVTQQTTASATGERGGRTRSVSRAGAAIRERITIATAARSMPDGAGAWLPIVRAIATSSKPTSSTIRAYHVLPGKVADVSQMVRDGSPIVKIQREIAKCVVRCANCHRRKTAREFWGRTGVYPRAADISCLVDYGGCSSVG